MTLLHHGLEHFEECKDYDIVLPLNENGELIGDSAFRKLDATYQEHASTKVAYSRVLGFSQKHKVPFAKG